MTPALLFLYAFSVCLSVVLCCVRVPPGGGQTDIYYKARCDIFSLCYVEVGGVRRLRGQGQPQRGQGQGRRGQARRGPGARGGARGRARGGRGRRNLDSDEPDGIFGGEIYDMCNTNNDEYIEMEEYRKCLNIPSFSVLEMFSRFDKNEDGKLYAEELNDLELRLVGTRQDCFSNILRICTLRTLMFLRGRNVTSICSLTKEYLDCFSEYDTCPSKKLESFKNKVEKIVQFDSITNPLCNKQYRKPTVSSELPSCSVSSIIGCGNLFLSDIHDGVEPCDSLETYRSCISRTTEQCNDATSVNTRIASDALISAYIDGGLCPRFREPNTD